MLAISGAEVRVRVIMGLGLVSSVNFLHFQRHVYVILLRKLPSLFAVGVIPLVSLDI